ncbi:hypothetical protein PC128_g6985 [Phytophthora cactorum]|nr:hypothetical protein PC128_g6985 [Phytophthora cactorum]
MTAYLEKLSMLLLPRSSSAFSMAASTERPPFTKLHTQLMDYHSIQYTTRSKVDARRNERSPCIKEEGHCNLKLHFDVVRSSLRPSQRLAAQHDS